MNVLVNHLSFVTPHVKNYDHVFHLSLVRAFHKAKDKERGRHEYLKVHSCDFPKQLKKKNK